MYLRHDDLPCKKEYQSAVNMVDLIMWIVIAALMLAAAIQGIGFYQQRAYIEQMMNDSNGAGTNVLAEMSNEHGVLDDALLRRVVRTAATSGDVALTPVTLGNGYYAIEATHPLVNKNRVIYAFAQRNGLEVGVNLKQADVIDLGSGSVGGSTCDNESWFVQYYNEYQPKGVPNKAPIMERCETGPLSHVWGTGAPNVPGMPVDRFSIHYSQNFETTSSAEYEFLVDSDNAAWVYLDGKQIIDNSIWYSSAGATTQKAYVKVAPGKHNVTVRYNENNGGAKLVFTQKVVTP